MRPKTFRSGFSSGPLFHWKTEVLINFSYSRDPHGIGIKRAHLSDLGV